MSESKQARITVDAQANPLAQYFRVPGYHITLPTNGAYLPPDSIEFTMTGEVPIFPMRAADELLLKSPDALMSGYALEKLIESCVPAIKCSPRLIATPDLDVILLAIRAASFGETMDIEVKCPSCGEINTYSVELPPILATASKIPEETPVRFSDDVVVYIRPYNLDNATKLAMASFTEAKKLRNIEKMPDDDAKQARINESYSAINVVSQSLLAECVYKVVTPAGTVDDRKNIHEFLGNVPRSWSKMIDEALRGLNDKSLDKRVALKCQSCGHEWTTEIEFDPINFFVQGS
jgi:hypothetical protein